MSKARYTISMMNWWKAITTQRPWLIITGAALTIAAMAWYGSGLFGEIASSDQFTARGTESEHARQVIEEQFGTTPSTEIVLFEQRDAALGAADSPAYQAEVARILAPLSGKVNSIKTYATEQSAAFLSKDRTKTIALIEGAGGEKDIYRVLTEFQAAADQSQLVVTIGGASVVSQQMNETVTRDLARTELVTFPILLLLLVVFFGSVAAALVPLGIGAFTIIGAFAVARLVNHVVPIDHYAVNVVTILGIGLAIDYALLSVNRFREELHAHESVQRAVRTVIDTSGRTIFFSGVTVIACMLSLLVFPMDFLHSIAIGSASAVLVAMLFTVLVLPAVLMVVGKRINAWRVPFVKQHTGTSRFWIFVANITTKHPRVTAIGALLMIGLVCVPLSQLKLASAMDSQYVASGTSGRHVMQTIEHDFANQSPGITAVLTVPPELSTHERIVVACNLTAQITGVPHVSGVVSPTMLPPGLSCEQFSALQQSALLPAQLSALYDQYSRQNSFMFSVSLDAPNGSVAANDALRAIRDLTPQSGEWLVGGTEGAAYDTDTAYVASIPAALTVIGVSMFVLLALLLASAVIPLQAIIINAVSLAISFAVLVAVFQLGWIDAVTRWGTVSGIVMTPLILIAVIAFGLAMDYSVFLYSRMFEVYQKTNDSARAIKQGIIKTGPIISAAAVMVFVVIVAFAGSSMMFMRMIGIGLGVAVLVDAFFVRLLLVPSLMTLLGRASWYAPRWLKRLQIRHE